MPKDSSAYLFETRRYKAIDVRIVPFLMRIHRSEVILQTIFETKLRLGQLKSLDDQQTANENGPAQQPFQRVYTINSRRVAQSLDLFVGNERMNSANMVDELIKYKMKKSAAAEKTDNQGNRDPAATPEPTSAEQYRQALKERYALKVPVDLMGFYLVKLGEQSKFKEAMAKCYVQATCFLNSMRLVKSAPDS